MKNLLVETCPLCCDGAEFGSVGQVVQHQQTFHAKEVAIYRNRKQQCNHCQISFATSKAFATHRRERHDVRQSQFQCHLCPKGYEHERSLRRHIREVHCNESVSEVESNATQSCSSPPPRLPWAEPDSSPWNQQPGPVLAPSNYANCPQAGPSCGSMSPEGASLLQEIAVSEQSQAIEAYLASVLADPENPGSKIQARMVYNSPSFLSFPFGKHGVGIIFGVFFRELGNQIFLSNLGAPGFLRGLDDAFYLELFRHFLLGFLRAVRSCSTVERVHVPKHTALAPPIFASSGPETIHLAPDWLEAIFQDGIRDGLVADYEQVTTGKAQAFYAVRLRPPAGYGHLKRAGGLLEPAGPVYLGDDQQFFNVCQASNRDFGSLQSGLASTWLILLDIVFPGQKMA